MQRHKTKHVGVYFRLVDRIGGPGKEKMFFITFKKSGKFHEEKCGGQFRDRMTEGRPPGSGPTASRAGAGAGRRSERKRQRRISAGQLTLACVAYFESLEYNPAKSRKAVAVDRNRYENFIKDRLGIKEPRELQLLDIERLRRELQKTRCTLKGKPESTRTLSPATIRATLTLLKRICNYGSKNGLCAGLPVKIQMPKISNVVIEDLNDEQLKRLLAAIEADTNTDARGILLLALYTGMRRGELFKLERQDVDFDRGFIRIVGPRADRTRPFPLNAAARRVLEAHPRTCEVMLPGRDGGQRVTIQKALRRIREVPP